MNDAIFIEDTSYLVIINKSPKSGYYIAHTPSIGIYTCFAQGKRMREAFRKFRKELTEYLKWEAIYY